MNTERSEMAETQFLVWLLLGVPPRGKTRKSKLLPGRLDEVTPGADVPVDDVLDLEVAVGGGC